MKSNPLFTPIPEVGVSALRGLASAGYFTQEQLAAMEDALNGKKKDTRAEKQWLTVVEACRHTRLSRTTLWKYCHAGRLTIHRIGGRRLIEQSELDAFMMLDQTEIKTERSMETAE